jgi:glucan phosphoethanolaminetransferase (alkaline phosphatase superfamily)
LLLAEINEQTYFVGLTTALNRTFPLATLSYALLISSNGNWITKAIVIIIPLIIFVVSWSLIIQSWSMSDTTLAESILSGDTHTNQKVFSVAYFIVLVLFLCCYVIIAREWFIYAKLYRKGKVNDPTY